MKLLLLGTSAGNGVPSFYCQCEACVEARKDKTYSRARSAALLDLNSENILIDTPPDIGVQLERFGVEKIDKVFLTHWHYDHFGGLGELEFYVRLKHRVSLPLYLPESALENMKKSFDYLLDCFTLYVYNKDFRLSSEGIDFFPVEANHGIETYGFIIKSEKRSIAYLPDTSYLGANTQEILKDVDIILIDATFYGQNWMPDTHLSVEEAVNFCRHLEIPETYLTHLSMHYSQPITSKKLEEEIEKLPGIYLAYDGKEFNL